MKKQRIQMRLACNASDRLSRAQTGAHRPVAFINWDAASQTMRFPRNQTPECLHIGITRDITLEVLGVCDMAKRLLNYEPDFVGRHD
jgi:hypothetical protein